MSQTVELRFTDGRELVHEGVFNCEEEGSFYKVRELRKTSLYPTTRIHKVVIEESENYHG